MQLPPTVYRYRCNMQEGTYLCIIIQRNLSQLLAIRMQNNLRVFTMYKPLNASAILNIPYIYIQNPDPSDQQLLYITINSNHV